MWPAEAIQAAYHEGTTEDQREAIRRWVRDSILTATPEALELLLHDLEHVSRRGKPLTPREQHVLALAAQGLTTKDTAIELGIGVETVKTYRHRASEKLGAHTVTQAVVLWFGGSMKTAHLEVYPRLDDRFDWRLIAANGEIVCQSTQGFTTRHDAARGATRARLLMAEDPQVRYMDGLDPDEGEL